MVFFCLSFYISFFFFLGEFLFLPIIRIRHWKENFHVHHYSLSFINKFSFSIVIIQ